MTLNSFCLSLRAPVNHPGVRLRSKVLIALLSTIVVAYLGYSYLSRPRLTVLAVNGMPLYEAEVLLMPETNRISLKFSLREGIKGAWFTIRLPLDAAEYSRHPIWTASTNKGVVLLHTDKCQMNARPGSLIEVPVAPEFTIDPRNLVGFSFVVESGLGQFSLASSRVHILMRAG